MHEPVVVVAWVLEEIGPDNPCGNAPLLVWNIGVDVACANGMEHGEDDQPGKCGHWHPVLCHIVEKRYE